MLTNKGENMTIDKDYDKMKKQVDEHLSKVSELVGTFDLTHNSDLSNDLSYKLDEVSDLIEDNYEVADFED